MGAINKLIDKLRLGGSKSLMVVLTPDEAQAVYHHIEALECRIETKELKFMAVCDRAYEMVQMNRDLRRKLDELTEASK